MIDEKENEKKETNGHKGYAYKCYCGSTAFNIAAIDAPNTPGIIRCVECGFEFHFEQKPFRGIMREAMLNNKIDEINPAKLLILPGPITMGEKVMVEKENKEAFEKYMKSKSADLN